MPQTWLGVPQGLPGGEEWMYGRTDGKSPHSTGLRPQPGPLPNSTRNGLLGLEKQWDSLGTSASETLDCQLHSMIKTLYSFKGSGLNQDHLCSSIVSIRTKTRLYTYTAKAVTYCWAGAVMQYNAKKVRKKRYKPND